MSRQPEKPIIIVNSEGAVEKTMRFPAPEFSSQHYLAAQQITSSDARTGRWISAYRLADGFFLFNEERPLSFRGWFVEPIPFPALVTKRVNGGVSTELQDKPLPAARSATFSTSAVYVLFGGASSDRNKVIDAYSTENGSYLQSFLLPEAVREIAWYNGGFYTLRDDPEPELAYWRPVGTTIP
ncbi:MAG TPA: hypothetical protein VE871_14130 [Longimicrobium sp.]|nr:hypothetical protein [Longimicrobium sp.]